MQLDNAAIAWTEEDIAREQAAERINRLRHRYQCGDAYISVERARWYTQSWQETESSGLSNEIRVAMAMHNVYQNMTHYVDPDDHIAGYWTEHFLGVPIDIERGVFNTVLGAELKKSSMLRFRVVSALQTMGYLVRKGTFFKFVRGQRAQESAGGSPLDLGLKTMQERQVNPFQIADDDRRELLQKLLPWWKGQSLADVLATELADAGVHSDDMQEFVMALPGNTSRQVQMLSSCATIATIQGHLILDYRDVLTKGLLQMRSEQSERVHDGGLDPAQQDFHKAREIAIEGVVVFAERLAERIKNTLAETDDPLDRDRLEQLWQNCSQVPLRPARTFREAVQAMWTVKTAVELAHPVNLHCFGRLDQILWPYYQADLGAGRIVPAEAEEILQELLLKVMSQNIRPESGVLSHFYHRYFGSSPITLAGVTPDGKDATNDLTYIFLRAAHMSKAVTNVSVRIAESTPDAVLQTIAEKLYDGTSSFSLFNDGPNIEAMRRRGFADVDANDYAVMGCVETTCPGRTGSMSANALLLSRVLDITMRNGDSRILVGTLKGEGLQTGTPDSFPDFEAFLSAFLHQGAYFIKKIVRGSNIRDALYARMQPAPLISAFTDGCVQSGKDITHAGAKYDLSGISLINSIANVTDSLLTIKRLVFEQQITDLATLLAAVDANYVGFEELAGRIKQLEGKWGNGHPESDDLARRIMRSLCGETYLYQSFKGAPFVAYAISMTTHTIDGRLSIATPDGRRAATPYAASANPYNVERAGVTAALRSVAALPSKDLMGCAVNMRFHPTGIGRTPAARRKWVQLVRTYFALGGSQMQPTVASVDVLRAAQQTPDQYRDLIVKVGGYSTYFVELGHEIQEEIIARTEHAH